MAKTTAEIARTPETEEAIGEYGLEIARIERVWQRAIDAVSSGAANHKVAMEGFDEAHATRRAAIYEAREALLAAVLAQASQ